ncbi:RGS domain-containing protein [Plasmodiophora brassicae]|nr:hypothetical protein PBRA_001574 [Plasmodiophora brassicae]
MMVPAVILFWATRRSSRCVSARRPHTTCFFFACALAFTSSNVVAFVYPDRVAAWQVIAWHFAFMGLALDAIVVLVWNYFFLFNLHRERDARRPRRKTMLDGSTSARVAPAGSAERSGRSWFEAHTYLNSVRVELLFLALNTIWQWPLLLVVVVYHDQLQGPFYATVLDGGRPGTVYLAVLTMRLVVFAAYIAPLIRYLRKTASDSLGIVRSFRRIDLCHRVTHLVILVGLALYFGSVRAWHDTVTIAGIIYVIPIGIATPYVQFELVVVPLYQHATERQALLDESGVPASLFEKFLGTRDGYDMMMRAATLEFSTENLLFWEAVRKFERNWPHLPEDRRRLDGEQIRKTFLVSDHSAQTVNVSAGALRAATADPTIRPDTFDVARAEVLQLMRKDTFARYVGAGHGGPWERFLQKENELDFLHCTTTRTNDAVVPIHGP